ncbi:MAG: hypothetical protein II704_00270 [Erysipelotrichaceae bacterium]|nr:hypothetical protein [Erysipelotrichaceae bacterium]
MEKKQLNIAGREVILYEGENPRCLIIHSTDSQEIQAMDSLITLLKESGEDFAMAVFKVSDWNGDLSPWPADPVFGREGFAGEAAKTLEIVEKELVAKLSEVYDVPVIIGGYSLAGLFALWAGYQSDRFAAVAAVSPSVWFDGWKEYAENNRIKVKNVYLSLGDREEKTRNQRMARVGDNIRLQKQLLEAAGVRCALEWNPGNHFVDFDKRCAAGYNWCRREITG